MHFSVFELIVLLFKFQLRKSSKTPLYTAGSVANNGQIKLVEHLAAIEPDIFLRKWWILKIELKDM